ncbi:uncharacterized protein A4U43_C10F9410 [Asparagus officinalis]|uniref:Uncharacterized protein n=1 Tax=Asparagus officinalis TaxID=4686 RepID=A0A5P1E1M7_ASPOF|nr:uncharacterized protein A4U43_C10F9410 [Asparagus officinalis]
MGTGQSAPGTRVGRGSRMKRRRGAEMRQGEVACSVADGVGGGQDAAGVEGCEACGGKGKVSGSRLEGGEPSGRGDGFEGAVEGGGSEQGSRDRGERVSVSAVFWEKRREEKRGK